MKKQIVSQTRQFQPSYDDELLLDDTPRVNSFNCVTSDGIARAIAGASGEVPVVTESDNGKVLKAIYDEGGPAVEWGEVESGSTYTGGAGISIDGNNAINVNAGAGIEIGESSVVENVEVFIEDYPNDDGKLYHFGRLDSNIDVDWLSGGQRTVTLLHDYVIDPVNNCFCPAICALDNNDPNSFDVTQRLVFGNDVEVGWEQDYIPAGQDFVVDSTAVNTGRSTITMADVLASPSDFVLTVIPYSYTLQELDLTNKFYMQGEAKETVTTVSLASSVTNAVKVKNPVPDNTSDSSKILISHGTGFAPQWGELESGNCTIASGLRVNVSVGPGLVVDDQANIRVKAGSGLAIGQDTVTKSWTVQVESSESVDYLASMAANAWGTYGYNGIVLADAINLQGSIKVSVLNDYYYDGSNDLGSVCVAVVAKDPENPYGIDTSSRLFYSGDITTGLTGVVPSGTELWFNAFDADSEGLGTISWQDVVNYPDNYVLTLLAGDGLGDVDPTAKYTAQVIVGQNTIAGSYYEANFLKMDPVIPSVVGNEGKVLAVNSVDAAYGLEWVAQQGGGDTPLPAIANDTIRFKFGDSTYDPSVTLSTLAGTWSRVTESSDNVWDYTYANSSWSSMFSGKFTDISTNPVEILGANLVSVENMSGMFQSCTGLLDGHDFIVSSTVKNASTMFYGCQNLKNLPFTSLNLLASSTSVDMSSMCNGCRALENVDLTFGLVGSHPSPSHNYASMFTSCNTMKVFNLNILGIVFANGNAMLSECSKLKSVTFNGAPRFNNVSTMFFGDSALESLPPAIVIEGSTISLDNMFRECGALRTFPVIRSSTTSEGSDMRVKCSSLMQTFFNCISMEEVPAWLKTSTCTNFSGAFRNCQSLRSIPYIDTSAATDVSNMFYNARSVSEGALELYQQMSTQTTPPSTTTNCFAYCGVNNPSGTADLAQIPASYGGTGA